MQFTKTHNRFVLRLIKGEEIISSLTSFCRENSVATGFFFGIGAASHIELAFYNLEKKAYSSKQFTDNYEIVSLLGNVSMVEKEPFVHAHTVLSGKDFACIGGHLKKAITTATCEIFLALEEIEIERVFDESTGLNLLNCTIDFSRT